MSKYLAKVTYHQESIKALLKEGGTVRKNNVERAVRSIGGTLESFYFAFGDTDVFAIIDFPDDASAAALSLAVGSRGAISVETTVLIPPETMDQAAGKAASYRPGGDMS